MKLIERLKNIWKWSKVDPDEYSVGFKWKDGLNTKSSLPPRPAKIIEINKEDIFK